MKSFIAFFAVVAVAVAQPEAVAKPKADAAYLYQPYGYNYASAVNAYGAAPAVATYGAATYGAAYNPYYTTANIYNPYVARVFKREAEAEAEADPAYLYQPYGYNYASAVNAYGAAPAVATYAAATYGAAYNPYYTTANIYNPYAARVFKREAEAEADPAYLTYAAGLPYASAYGGAYVTPSAYSAYRTPYTTYNTAYTTPYVASNYGYYY